MASKAPGTIVGGGQDPYAKGREALEFKELGGCRGAVNHGHVLGGDAFAQGIGNTHQEGHRSYAPGEHD
jgi:hypothetical protein